MPFPILFTIGGNRHELILVPHDTPLGDLNDAIARAAASSPNCAEFMSKYKKQEEAETVTEIKVRWSAQGRDAKIWPATTVVTAENCTAVLLMMEKGVGQDVLEVKLGGPQAGDKS
ncbi:hypothetical protein M501DRAFT_994415 [Patellaria atrata CBS 101060]|uniref:Uncharacterized protein n=1 Tax=Patellaria atrata CBS 101060 TaxID=1346257 RepID=A0A9P4VS03_9PEZI|nr:hypothetical protein M501DRAFT_994415 [Patellaria atrata CBS 101060]